MGVAHILLATYLPARACGEVHRHGHGHPLRDIVQRDGHRESEAELAALHGREEDSDALCTKTPMPRKVREG